MSFIRGGRHDTGVLVQTAYIKPLTMPVINFCGALNGDELMSDLNCLHLIAAQRNIACVRVVLSQYKVREDNQRK